MKYEDQVSQDILPTHNEIDLNILLYLFFE